MKPRADEMLAATNRRFKWSRLLIEQRVEQPANTLRRTVRRAA